MRTSSGSRVRHLAFLLALMVGSVLTVPLTHAHSLSYIRVDQVGYAIGSPKSAFVLAAGDQEGNRFAVLDGAGAEVLVGDVGPSAGKWSDKYPFVHRLDISSVDTPGTYTISSVGEVSPPFRIGPARDLFGPVVDDIVSFLGAQRDGPDVIPGELGRRPSHLADQEAFIYKLARYRDGVLVRRPERIGGPIDVSGGWHDAGDYLKFTGQQAYSTALLLMALRDNPGSFTGSAAMDEARHSIEWLDKMYDESTGVLYQQVGIGSGNDRTLSDHDLWRLPEEDDALEVSRRDKAYFVKHRPVFRANAPGKPISPNLAGRVSATFALCSQVFRATDPGLADSCLAKGRAIFDSAKTQDVTRLQGAVPLAFYAEEQWRDDLEWGAAELALAFQPDTEESAAYTRTAASWAKALIASEGDKYPAPPIHSNVTALAHVEFVRAFDNTGSQPVDGASRGEVVADIVRHLEGALREGDEDPFGLGGYDSVWGSNGWGWVARAYQEVTGDDRFASFARDQLNWVLGANPWGVSFVVGSGTTFAKCLHHQVANLSGSLDGSGPILRGAVTYGPGSPGDFKGLGDGGARSCFTKAEEGHDAYTAFTGHNLRFMDAVKAWPSVEPAIDYGAAALLFIAEMSGP